MRMREKEIIYEVETLHDKNSNLQQELQESAQVRDSNS